MLRPLNRRKRNREISPARLSLKNEVQMRYIILKEVSDIRRKLLGNMRIYFMKKGDLQMKENKQSMKHRQGILY